MVKKSLFNAPEPIFNSNQEPNEEQLYLDGFAPDAFEDIGHDSRLIGWGPVKWSGTFIRGILRSTHGVILPIEVIDDTTSTLQNGWTLCVGGSTSNIAVHNDIVISTTIFATPPTTPRIDGLYRLQDTDTGTRITYNSDTVYVNTFLIWSQIRGGRTLSGQLTFYEAAVSGITTSDFEVIDTNGNIQSDWDITSVSSSAVSAGQHIIVVASPPDDVNGDFSLRLKANSITRNSANYPSNPIPSGETFVDSRAQSAIVATASWSHVTGGQFLRGRITFAGSAVTSVSSSDFEVINSSGTVQSNWCIHLNRSATTISTNYITVTANPPAGQNASFRLRLKATSVRSGGSNTDNAPAEAQTSSAVDIDSRAPSNPVVAGATWSNVSGGTRLSGDLTFTGAAVVHIGPEDFQVLNSSGTSQSNWEITVSSSSVAAGGFITVTALPPANTDDDFRLRLRSTSVRSGGSSTNNAPTANEDTDLENVDNTVTIATATFGNVELTYRDWSGQLIPDWNGVLANIRGVRPGIQVSVTFSGSNVLDISTEDFGIIDASSTDTTGSLDLIRSARGTVGAPGVFSPARPGFARAVVDTVELYDSLTDNMVPGAVDGNSITLLGFWYIHTADRHFKFRFNANSVRSGGSTFNNAPENAIFSNSIYLNTTYYWHVTGGRTLTSLISNVSSLASINSTYSIINEQGQTVTGWRLDRSGSGSRIRFSWGGGINASDNIVGHPPPNTGGLFKIRLNANSIPEFGGGGGTAPQENVDSEYVVVDNISTIAGATWSNVHYCTTNNKLQATLTFSGVNVTNIDASDFEVPNTTGWIFDMPPSSASAGSGILIAATPPANTSGPYRFRLKAGTVRSAGASFNNAPSTNLDSDLATVDNRAATVSDGAWSNVNGGVALNGRMTFTGAAVTGIEDDDFAVLDDSNMEQSGWMIDVSASFTTAGGFVDVTATPPLGTSGDFKLQLDATSVMSGGSLLNNAPAAAIISGERAIDTTGLIVTWGTPVFCGTSNEVDSTISFSHDVTGFGPADIVVRNAGDTDNVSGWTHTISGTGRTYTIESVPPAGTNSIFRLRLLANSVGFRPSETGPTHNADSPQFNVDNRTSLNPPSAEFVIPNDIQTGATTDIAISFGERVWVLSEFDFTITGYDPEPSKLILAQDHQIRIRTAQSNTPIFRLRNIPSAPSIVSTIRSPLGPSSGPTDRWIIRLSRPFRDLIPNEVVYKTISTGPDVSLNRNPIFVDSNYTLRITNPTNASGTLNAVLRKYAVNAVDDNLRGPEVPQNSGSYAFDTVILPQFTIGDAYASGDAADTSALDEPFDEATVYVEIEIDQSATSLQASDFIVSGACGGSPLSILTENRKWRLPVHIPDADKGNMTVAIPSNVIDQRNQPASKTFEFDRTTEGQLEQPYLVVSNLPTTEQTSNSFTFTVTAYVDGTMVNLENLEPSDFRITSPEGDITPTSVS